MEQLKRNAIILAAGTSSRFVPISEEVPKGLLEVRGEVLIERQIRQLTEAGIHEIIVVVGYMHEKFNYLIQKYGVTLIKNEEFRYYNNTSSIVRALDYLHNTFICSSDNYFPSNVFLSISDCSYYSAKYTSGETSEYCIITDNADNIIGVKIGGSDSWYMVGHVFFSEEFSQVFKRIIRYEYQFENTKKGYWEDVYIKHINDLPPMKIKRYQSFEIEEFDTLEDLRLFDHSYLDDTRSSIIKEIANAFCCKESELTSFSRIKTPNNSLQFSFRKGKKTYVYNSLSHNILEI